VRNKTCFEKILIRDPCDIMFFVCSFIRYWAGLYSKEMQVVIRSGVEMMMRTAFKILGGRARLSVLLRIAEGPAVPQTTSGEDDDAQEAEEDFDVPMSQRDDE
jgi:hypothetical protein